MLIDTERCLTVAQAAEKAEVGYTTLDRWLTAGYRGRTLPYTRFGSSKVIKVGDLREFLRFYHEAAATDGRTRYFMLESAGV